MSASADVLAMAKVEVDLAAIPEGKNVSLSIRIQTTLIETLISGRLCRSSSSGEASPFSSDTEPSTRSPRPARSTSSRSETPKMTQTV